MWRNYVRDVAVPCGFARPWWKVHLRGAVPLGERETRWCKRNAPLVRGVSCDTFASSAWRAVWRNYVRDVAVPCGFAQPWWKVHLRGAVPLGERETRWCKRGAPLVRGMMGGIM